MHLYTNIFGLVTVPTYGLMIAIGVIIANIIALFLLKKNKFDINDFIILEGYCLMGAFFGAKLLYLVVSYKDIDWSRILEPAYFNELMLGGFVFYGGLIFGLIFVFIGGKIHKINTVLFIREFIFLIPLIHGFGRIGCFMAGCCYGVPYHGHGAVIFPENSYAIPGIELFPIQIVEAVLLFCIAALILFLRIKNNFHYTVELYFILYGITRFILEFYRYDAIRGVYFGFSTSQWISIVMLLVALGLLITSKIQKKATVIL